MSDAAVGTWTQLRVTGDPLAFSDEPLTLISGTGGKLWQISASAKQFWDPGYSFTIAQDSDGDGTIDSGEEIDHSNFDIHYLFGLVEFDTDRSGQTLLAEGGFFPNYHVPMGTSVDITTSYNVVDLPLFFDAGLRTELGLGTLEGTVGRFDVENLPLDGQGGSEDSLRDIFGEARRMVLSVGPEGTTNDQPGGPRQGEYRRAWCRISEESMSTSLDELAETEISVVPARKPAADALQTAELWDSFDFG